MKIFICIIIVLAALFYGAVEAGDQAKNDLHIITARAPSPGSIKLSIAIPASASGGITVNIANTATKPIGIWRESNSWGATNWRVFLVRKGTLEVFYQNPDQDFSRNIPASDEIPGNNHIERMLDINGENWCGLGHCNSYGQHGFGGKTINFEPNDIIIVSYDVPYTDEAKEFHVWYGFVSAMTTIPAIPHKRAKPK